MSPTIHFVEYENRVVSATYRKLMVKAKIVLVELATGAQLAAPVTTITSHFPVGSLRIRLPEAIKPGTYYLLAFNAHGIPAARSSAFVVD